MVACWRYGTIDDAIGGPFAKVRFPPIADIRELVQHVGQST